MATPRLMRMRGHARLADELIAVVGQEDAARRIARVHLLEDVAHVALLGDGGVVAQINKLIVLRRETRAGGEEGRV